MSGQPAVTATGLVKFYGRARALDGLDLQVDRGDVHGFLGPNGAGKTTTLRTLLGLIRADAGTVSVLGADPWRDTTALHHRIAYVPGDVTFWPNLTGGQVIGLLARLRGDADQRRRAELLERFELDPGKRIRAYSKGNRQKVALVAAFESSAELLILDEPTSGLDPLMEQVFRDCIREEAASGDRTVLLSSHILAEVEALCSTITIVRAGRVVEHGALSELRMLGRTRVDARLSTGSNLTGLSSVAGVHDLVINADRVSLQADSTALDAVLGRLAAAGLAAISCQPPTLEELFLRQYAGAGS